MGLWWMEIGNAIAQYNKKSNPQKPEKPGDALAGCLWIIIIVLLIWGLPILLYVLSHP